MPLNIEYVAVSDLRAYDKNARTHSPDQVAQLVASINEFGFTNPVLIDENNELIAGHGRTQAAQSMGLEKVPAIRLVGLSDQQKKALRIADNQLALNAGWDLDLLAQEIQQLDLDGFDLEVLGFDDKYLADLLDGNVSGGVTEDDAAADMPSLPSGDREPFQQKTFTLHDEQAAIVDDAITLARTSPVVDTGLNENSNGNALTLICREWLEMKNGDR